MNRKVLHFFFFLLYNCSVRSVHRMTVRLSLGLGLGLEVRLGLEDQQKKIHIQKKQATPQTVLAFAFSHTLISLSPNCNPTIYIATKWVLLLS